MMTMSSYLDLFRDIPGDLIGENICLDKIE